MASIDELEQAAKEFAGQLERSLSAFADEDVELDVDVLGNTCIVTNSDKEVCVKVKRGASLTLTVRYKCSWDSASSYLKVLKSSVAVVAGPVAESDPLFRYEYVHDQKNDLPASHIHVHAHRDQFTRIMTLASLDKKKRSGDGEQKEIEASRMAKVHFPTGGHRFRPTLEDVLQLLEVEFNVQPGPYWQKVLRENRAQWRRQQTGAAVRDCPSEAARVLEELGYQVTLPGGGHAPDNQKRLKAF